MPPWGRHGGAARPFPPPLPFFPPPVPQNYVHRIGRTGRCGKTGIATTFINKGQSEITLLDLKVGCLI